MGSRFQLVAKKPVPWAQWAVGHNTIILGEDAEWPYDCLVMKQIRGYRPIKDSERFRVRYVFSSESRYFHKRLVNAANFNSDKIFNSRYSWISRTEFYAGIWIERNKRRNKHDFFHKFSPNFVLRFLRIYFKKFWHSIRSSQWRATIIRSSSKVVEKRKREKRSNRECGECW